MSFCICPYLGLSSRQWKREFLSSIGHLHSSSKGWYFLNSLNWSHTKFALEHMVYLYIIQCWVVLCLASIVSSQVCVRWSSAGDLQEPLLLSNALSLQLSQRFSPENSSAWASLGSKLYLPNVEGSPGSTSSPRPCDIAPPQAISWGIHGFMSYFPLLLGIPVSYCLIVQYPKNPLFRIFCLCP